MHITKMKWLKHILTLDCLVTVAIVLAAFSVDGNGRILGLNENISLLLAGFLFLVGISLNILVLVFRPGYRIIAVLIFILYLLLGLPAIGL